MSAEPSLDGRLESRRSLVGGYSIHARIAAGPDDRPGIVMAHGFVVSSTHLVPLAERLAGSFRIYAPDLPGFGRSEKPRDVLTVQQLSDTLAEWTRAMSVGRAVLLGNSFGCQLAVLLATRHPDLFERLILIGPSVPPGDRTVLEQLGRFLLDATRELPPKGFFEDIYAAGLRRAWQTARYALADRMEDRLERIPLPTLVIRGSRDPICPQAWADEIVRRLPQGRLVVIPRKAHTVVNSAVEECATAICEFLNEGC